MWPTFSSKVVGRGVLTTCSGVFVREVASPLMSKKPDTTHQLNVFVARNSTNWISVLLSTLALFFCSQIWADTNLKFDEITLETNLNANLIIREDEISGKLEEILATSEQIAKVGENENDESGDNSSDNNLQTDSVTGGDGDGGQELAVVQPAEQISEQEAPEQPQEQTTEQSTESTTEPIQADDIDQIASEIESAMRSWASAWSSQDVEEYLDHYSSEFLPYPASLTRDQWADLRKQRLQKPKKIELSLSDIELTGIENEVTRVVFRQNYNSDSYRDEVIKSLDFTHSDGSWKILSEKTVKVLK